MKTTKSILLTLALAAFLMMNASAQKHHEFNVTGGQKIIVENLLGKILVKNHSGGSLIIKTDEYGELPEKAKGLKEIYSGSVDNTGIGIAVKSSGKSIFVNGASKRSEDATYTFLVPKGVNMSIDYSSPFGYETIEVEGFSGELEAKTLNEDISLKNVTGPMSIHTINGDVSADFSSLSQTSPTGLIKFLIDEVDEKYIRPAQKQQSTLEQCTVRFIPIVILNLKRKVKKSMAT